jgi:hypothetical protein
LACNRTIKKRSVTSGLLNLELKKVFVGAVGPEYLAIGLTAIVSAVTGGGWVANRLLDRQRERIQQALDYTGSQKRRIDILEDQINRMPMEYVLKVDFLREIKEMHDNFREINNKLDKLMEKILSK